MLYAELKGANFIKLRLKFILLSVLFTAAGCMSLEEPDFMGGVEETYEVINFYRLLTNEDLFIGSEFSAVLLISPED